MRCSAQKEVPVKKSQLGALQRVFSSLFLTVLTFWAVESVVPLEEWRVYVQTAVFPCAGVGNNLASAAARCIALTLC